MRRAYNVHAGGLPDLVLDIPLYSASMEHLADRCGHETLFVGQPADLSLETANMAIGAQGVRIIRKFPARLPYWSFEPIEDARYTCSFFLFGASPSGHGWAWDAAGMPFASQTTFHIATSFFGNEWFFVEGVLLFQYDDNGYRRFMATPHFVTAVVDGTSAHLYIDGVFVKDGVSDNLALPFGCIGLRLTDADCGNTSNAVFRQFKLFRKALSPDEIAALYADELAEFNAAATTI